MGMSKHKGDATVPLSPSSTRETRAAEEQHRRSGAAGIHADQKAKHLGSSGKTNRIGSRSARRRAAVDEGKS